MPSLLIGALLSVTFGTGFLERYVVYYPMRPLAADPSQLGMPFEDVYLTAEDGTRVHGWFVPGKDPDGVTVLWLHGNGGNIGHRLDKLHLLRTELDANFFLLDYRGYGLSEGAPSEEGTYLDAQAALDHLLARDDVDSDRIVYYGHSLGSAVAVDLAKHHTPSALVLESAFPSVPRIAAHTLPPYLPLAWLLRTQYDSASKVGGVSAPMLFVHGDQDDVIPMDLGKELYEEAKGPKEFAVVRGAGHNDIYLVGGLEYASLWSGFIEERVSPAG